MRYKYTYKSKETGEVFRLNELEEKHRSKFESYGEFAKWIEDNYIEICEPILSPQERTRAAVYATGNRWAIENFNATHN